MELRRRGSSERIALADGMVLGRLPACDVTVEDASVSRRHAQVEVRGEAYALVDLGSSNGIFRNGERLKRVELRAGDLLTLGAVPFDVVAPIAGLADAPRSGAAATGDDEVFEIPVEEPAGEPRSAYVQAETERARLRIAHGRSRRSSGLGDLSQQPGWLRLLIYVGCVGLLYGVIQGVRLLGGAL